MEIIKASEKDIPAIRGLAEEIWPPTYTAIIGPGQVAYMLHLFYSADALARQMTEGHTFILGYDKERPIAFASYGPTAPGIFKLHKLYLLPEYQGKGLGASMIRCVTADIKKMGCGELRLNVNKFNHAAIAFYKKAGFLHLHDEDIDIGDGFFMNDHILGLPVD